jgi:hypothetical protein
MIPSINTLYSVLSLISASVLFAACGHSAGTTREVEVDVLRARMVVG